jgi:hypothetical protein
MGDLYADMTCLEGEGRYRDPPPLLESVLWRQLEEWLLGHAARGGWLPVGYCSPLALALHPTWGVEIRRSLNPCQAMLSSIDFGERNPRVDEGEVAPLVAHPGGLLGHRPQSRGGQLLVSGAGSSGPLDGMEQYPRVRGQPSLVTLARRLGNETEAGHRYRLARMVAVDPEEVQAFGVMRISTLIAIDVYTGAREHHTPESDDE